MRYNVDKLTDYFVDILCSLGVSPVHARQTATVLITADMRGVHSHGCVRMEGYVECLVTKGIIAGAVPKVVNEGPTYALVDAERGLGIPVSVFATLLAIEKAKKHGMAIVNVNNSHHHGACGYYTMLCAEQGLIGYAMSTGEPIMAITGSSKRCIGNNPFSYAVPAGRYRAICYDVAMSQVAAGKISLAAEEGKDIPLGWLLDKDGNPTKNPQLYELENGALEPFGGHKGYGLSVMVESMAGILSGANLLGDISAWNKDPNRGGGVGHCFMAFSPEIINPDLAMTERVETMIQSLTTSPKAPQVDRIYFPGQIENESEQVALSEGVVIPSGTQSALKRMADIVKTAFDMQTFKI